MGFFKEFCRAFPYNPLKALKALYWYTTRRRVRGRNLIRQISTKTAYLYGLWIGTVERLPEVAASAPVQIAGWSVRPSFSLVMSVEDHDRWGELRAAIDSVERQYYPEWELVLVADQGRDLPLDQSDDRIRRVDVAHVSDVVALEAGIMAAGGDFVVPLPRGARLSPAALFRFAETLQARPDAALLYGDHDEMSERGRRRRPWFKSEWNREMFLGQDYMSQAAAIRTDLARAALPLTTEVDGAACFALLLEVSARSQAAIVHVPHILSHVPDAMRQDDQAARRMAVSRHLEPVGGAACDDRFGLLGIVWPLPVSLPLVSIIIPTRDKVDLLKTCVESLLKLTDYPNFEILIVDNGSSEPDALRYLKALERKPRVRIVTHDAPFNFSELNNLAVAQARGTFLCLLNNDTEIISATWLSEMMRYAVQDHVGAVGAKLLYPDGTVQHAGVVIGIGEAAGHAHRFLKNDDVGYFGRAHVAHDVSAVTAACLVIAKQKYQAVGGLDAETLKVAFNDVDLCLKVQHAGWTNIYAPRAVLVHHESKSRGSDISQRNIARYLTELDYLQKKWGTADYRDPLHHPHLARSNETYVIHL